MPTLYVRHVAEPANQELASTACTPEPIHSSTDIIEINQSITSTLHWSSKSTVSGGSVKSAFIIIKTIVCFFYTTRQTQSNAIGGVSKHKINQDNIVQSTMIGYDSA